MSQYMDTIAEAIAKRKEGRPTPTDAYASLYDYGPGMTPKEKMNSPYPGQMRWLINHYAENSPDYYAEKFGDMSVKDAMTGNPNMPTNGQQASSTSDWFAPSQQAQSAPQTNYMQMPGQRQQAAPQATRQMPNQPAYAQQQASMRNDARGNPMSAPQMPQVQQQPQMPQQAQSASPQGRNFSPFGGQGLGKFSAQQQFGGNPASVQAAQAAALRGV